MAYESVTYAPLQIFAGESDVRAKAVTIPANQAAIPALTPLKRDANYKAVPATALTDEIIGILVPGQGSVDGALVGTTQKAADQTAYAYTHGDFFASQISFAAIATADNDLKKDALFDQTGINIKFVAAGLV